MSKVGIQLENTILTLESTDTMQSVFKKLKKLGIKHHDPIDEKTESKYFYTKYKSTPTSKSIKWNSVMLWIDGKDYVLQFKFDGTLRNICILLNTPGDLSKTDILKIITDEEIETLNEIIIQMRMLDVYKCYRNDILIDIARDIKIEFLVYR